MIQRKLKHEAGNSIVLRYFIHFYSTSTANRFGMIEFVISKSGHICSSTWWNDSGTPKRFCLNFMPHWPWTILEKSQKWTKQLHLGGKRSVGKAQNRPQEPCICCERVDEKINHPSTRISLSLSRLQRKAMMGLDGHSGDKSYGGSRANGWTCSQNPINMNEVAQQKKERYQ